MAVARGSGPGDGSAWVDRAGRLLANLGFTLVDSRCDAGASHLLVAVRRQPTLQHFDPEEVAYWVTEGGRGRTAVFDFATHLPIDMPFAWGRITLADRLGIANHFLSFGGRLNAWASAGDCILADFGSLAPILRSSGHSQGLDPLAAEVGAFFARVRVPIDFVPGAEDLVSTAAPSALYCAFLQDARERLARARALREANRWLVEFVCREQRRLERPAQDHWAAADELRRRLGIAGGAAGS